MQNRRTLMYKHVSSTFILNISYKGTCKQFAFKVNTIHWISCIESGLRNLVAVVGSEW